MNALNRKELIYSGRINWADENKPEFIFPASSLSFRFYGRKAEITVANYRACWKNAMGIIIDNEQKKWELNDEGQTHINIIDEEMDKIHEVLFFKRQDSCHVVRIEELKISGGGYLLPAIPLPQRRIELYGDSVSKGEVSEAVEYTGRGDPKLKRWLMNLQRILIDWVFRCGRIKSCVQMIMKQLLDA